MEKGLFSVEGRIRRSAFWTRWLIGLLISFIGGFISGMDASLAVLSPIISIAVAIFIIIQGVKRMHDVNKSGWYVIIPIYNFLLALTDGTHGTNKYGDDPIETIIQQSQSMNKTKTKTSIIIANIIAGLICIFIGVKVGTEEWNPRALLIIVVIGGVMRVLLQEKKSTTENDNNIATTTVQSSESQPKQSKQPKQPRQITDHQSLDPLHWENYCLFCDEYESGIGACSKIHENVRSYPKKFINKCNGKFFKKI